MILQDNEQGSHLYTDLVFIHLPEFPEGVFVEDLSGFQGRDYRYRRECYGQVSSDKKYEKSFKEIYRAVVKVYE